MKAYSTFPGANAAYALILQGRAGKLPRSRSRSHWPASSPETWPRGRRHSPAKGAYGPKPVSRVRIPPSPPTPLLCTDCSYRQGSEVDKLGALASFKTADNADLGRQSPTRCTGRVGTPDPLTDSALLPRQAVVAPAVFRAAPALLVKLAFEAVEHVVHLREAAALKKLARLARAVSGAANQ